MNRSERLLRIITAATLVILSGYFSLSEGLSLAFQSRFQYAAGYEFVVQLPDLRG